MKQKNCFVAAAAAAAAAPGPLVALQRRPACHDVGPLHSAIAVARRPPAAAANPPSVVFLRLVRLNSRSPLCRLLDYLHAARR